MIRARLDDGCAPLALLIHPQFGQMKYWNGVSNALRATGLARDVAADLLGEFHRRLCDRALRCAESYMASCLERNRINYEACDTISRLLRNMIVTGSAGIVASDTQNIVEGSQGSSQWHAVVTYRSTPAMGEFVSPKFFVPTYDLKSHAGMQREMDENAEQYRVLVWTMVSPSFLHSLFPSDLRNRLTSLRGTGTHLGRMSDGLPRAP